MFILIQIFACACVDFCVLVSMFLCVRVGVHINFVASINCIQYIISDLIHFFSPCTMPALPPAGSSSP